MAVMTVRVAGNAGQLNVVALLHDRFSRQGMDVALIWQDKMVVRRTVFTEQAPEFRQVKLDLHFRDGCQQLDTRHDMLLLLPPLGVDEALLIGVAATAGIPILAVNNDVEGLYQPEFLFFQNVYRPVTIRVADAVEAAEMVERIYGCMVARQHRDDACDDCACAPVCGVGR